MMVINKELLLWLGLMSILMRLECFVSKAEDCRPTLVVLWIVNILAAMLFGLGHLPATAALLPSTLLVVARAIALNGLIGIAAGYLFNKDESQLCSLTSQLISSCTCSWFSKRNSSSELLAIYNKQRKVF